MQILHNARIYTLDAGMPLVSALAVERGRITAAGALPDLRRLAPHSVELIDLKGATVLPGLTDAHIHLQQYAEFLLRIDCETPTYAECLRRIAARAATLPADAWLLGHGWNQNVWQDLQSSSAWMQIQDLDRICGGRPAYFSSKSLHAGWANTAALQRAGITRSTPDPENGKILRDDKGEPTGILLEDAVRLVMAVLPEPTPAQIRQSIRAAQAALWQLGITGCHDFDRRQSFTALQELHQSGELKLRVLKSIPLELLPAAVDLGLRTGFGDDRLRIGSVKLFADGALGPHTAAMFQPYAGTGELGMLFMDAEEIFEHGRQAVSSGLSLAIHAIGDRANHECINAFLMLEDFSQANGLPRLRHRMEHLQILHPDDLPRLQQSGVAASMQPIHAISDMETATQYWGERSRYSYAWRSIADLHLPLLFGSDAPVDSPNPFYGLAAAIIRQRPDGYPNPQGWYPEQIISLQAALQAYTTSPAALAGWQNHQARLLPGCYADLIVLEADPFQSSPAELRSLLPRATMFNGEWVYQCA